MSDRWTFGDVLRQLAQISKTDKVTVVFKQGKSEQEKTGTSEEILEFFRKENPKWTEIRAAK